MAEDTETTKPSEGVLARLAEKFGIKSESTVLAELKAESATLLETANEVQAELEAAKATITAKETTISGLNAKVSALDALVPGISSSATPASVLQEHITKAAAAQVAAAAFDPGSAPPVDPKASETPTQLTREEFQKLPVAKQNEYMRTVKKLKAE